MSRYKSNSPALNSQTSHRGDNPAKSSELPEYRSSRFEDATVRSTVRREPRRKDDPVGIRTENTSSTNTTLPAASSPPRYQQLPQWDASRREGPRPATSAASGTSPSSGDRREPRRIAVDQRSERGYLNQEADLASSQQQPLATRRDPRRITPSGQAQSPTGFGRSSGTLNSTVPPESQSFQRRAPQDVQPSIPVHPSGSQRESSLERSFMRDSAGRTVGRELLMRLNAEPRWLALLDFIVPVSGASEDQVQLSLTLLSVVCAFLYSHLPDTVAGRSIASRLDPSVFDASFRPLARARELFQKLVCAHALPPIFSVTSPFLQERMSESDASDTESVGSDMVSLPLAPPPDPLFSLHVGLVLGGRVEIFRVIAADPFFGGFVAFGSMLPAKGSPQHASTIAAPVLVRYTLKPTKNDLKCYQKECDTFHVSMKHTMLDLIASRIEENNPCVLVYSFHDGVMLPGLVPKALAVDELKEYRIVHGPVSGASTYETHLKIILTPIVKAVANAHATPPQKNVTPAPTPKPRRASLVGTGVSPPSTPRSLREGSVITPPSAASKGSIAAGFMSPFHFLCIPLDPPLSLREAVIRIQRGDYICRIVGHHRRAGIDPVDPIAKIFAPPDIKELTEEEEADYVRRFIPPAVIKGHRNPDEDSDIYCLGMLIVQMILGKTPLLRNENDIDELFQLLSSSTYSLSSGFLRLIRDMVGTRRNQVTAFEVLEAISDDSTLSGSDRHHIGTQSHSILMSSQLQFNIRVKDDDHFNSMEIIEKACSIMKPVGGHRLEAPVGGWPTNAMWNAKKNDCIQRLLKIGDHFFDCMLSLGRSDLHSRQMDDAVCLLEFIICPALPKCLANVADFPITPDLLVDVAASLHAALCDLHIFSPLRPIIPIVDSSSEENDSRTVRLINELLEAGFFQFDASGLKEICSRSPMLGKGGGGQVWKVKWSDCINLLLQDNQVHVRTNQEYVAVKQSIESQAPLAELYAILAAGRCSGSSNASGTRSLLPTIGYALSLDGETPNNVFTVSELIEGGSLDQTVESEGNVPLISTDLLDWSDRISIIRDIAEALLHIHRLSPQIIHQDVKPGNIFLRNFQRERHDEDVERASLCAVLGDFGIASVKRGIAGMSTNRTAVTPGYSTPEEVVSEKTDVYQLGVVMWQLITGWPLPFVHVQRNTGIFSVGQPQRHISNLAKTGAFSPVVEFPSAYVLNEFQQLATECCHDSAARRPTMVQIVTVLQHLLSSVQLQRHDCALCSTAPRNALLLPCRHTPTCSTCAYAMLSEGTESCPHCRSTITSSNIFVEKQSGVPSLAIHSKKAIMLAESGSSLKSEREKGIRQLLRSTAVIQLRDDQIAVEFDLTLSKFKVLPGTTTASNKAYQLARMIRNTADGESDELSEGPTGNIEWSGPVTLPPEALPPGAAFYAFVYPLLGDYINPKILQIKDQDPAFLLLTVGGFVYFNQYEEPVGISAMTEGTKIEFEWSDACNVTPQAVSDLEGKWQPVTLSDWRANGCVSFCWVPGGTRLAPGKGFRHGAFVYKFDDKDVIFYAIEEPAKESEHSLSLPLTRERRPSLYR